MMGRPDVHAFRVLVKVRDQAESMWLHFDTNALEYMVLERDGKRVAIVADFDGEIDAMPALIPTGWDAPRVDTMLTVLQEQVTHDPE